MRAHHQPIAVIGLSAIFPGSDDLSQYWRTILDGQDHIGPVPATHWRLEDYVRPEQDAQDHTWASRGGFLNPQPFDPLAFGIPPQLLEATDSAQLLTLIATERLLKDAYQGRFGQLDRDRMGVILGVTAGQPLMNSMASRLEHPIWARSMRAHGLEQPQIDAILETISAHYVPWQEASFPGLLGNVVAGRVANRFDLHGINCVVDAACGSSLGALALAIDELALGRADMMITGGVDTFNDIFMYVCFSRTHALSKSDRCRPFDADADGTLLGEGVGLVALKRLEDAVRDGDPIYAVIKGVGTSSDGKAKSIYAPLPQGQRRAIMRAYDQAGFDPSSVELIEAHGTGTRAGDAAELEGLHSVFGDAKPGEGPTCAIGSVKSQIGHTKAAAGTAGLIKAIMALHQRVLPATIKVSQENPALPQGSKLYINTTTRPWISAGQHPRRAGVSAFGFGGSNFHVALEEHIGQGRALAPVTARQELLTLGAMNAQALIAKIKLIQTRLDAGHRPSLIARSSQTESTGQHFSHRLSLIGASADELRARLRRALAMIEANPTRASQSPDGTSYGIGTKRAKVALICAGLEPVAADTGHALAIEQPQALDVWDKLARLHAQGRIERAPHTRRFTPPARATTQRAAREAELLIDDNLALAAAQLEILKATDIKLDSCAGFNAGELLALYAAEMIDLERLMRLGQGLGKTLSSYEHQHQTLLVMTSRQHLSTLLGSWPMLQITAQDHERQLMVSGPAQALEALNVALQEAQIITKKLALPVALHHPSLDGVGRQLDRLLAQWPLRQRATTSPALYDPERGCAYPDDLEQLKAQLSAHIAQPRTLESLWRGLIKDGHEVFVILGHDDTLSASFERLARIDRQRVTIAPLGHGDEPERLTLLKALGKLYAAGASMQLEPLWAHLHPEEAPLASTKPRMIIPISGANYRKRYPAAKPEDDPLFGLVIPSPKPLARPLEYELLDREDETAMTQHKQAQSHPIDPAWLAAFQETQRQMVEAHARFQEALTEGHRAFLEAMEHAQTQLAQVMSAHGESPQAKVAPTPLPAPQRAVTPKAPATPPPKTLTSAPTPPAPRHTLAPPAPPSPRQKPAQTTATQTTQTESLAKTLLSIVSQKTGYPESMLTLDLELEGDLGIDSIKRVEIFSALKDAVPTLPELDGSQMAQMASLQSIIDAVQSLEGATTPHTAHAAPTPKPKANGHSHGPTDAELTQTLLSIVSQKTGYPESMLTLDLELEGDLGIDSIKRVEIFSALKDAVPTLPELDGSQMAQMASLDDILAKLKATIKLAANATGASAFF